MCSFGFCHCHHRRRRRRRREISIELDYVNTVESIKSFRLISSATLGVRRNESLCIGVCSQ